MTCSPYHLPRTLVFPFKTRHPKFRVVKPTKLKSRLMELENSYENSFNFNLSSAEISDINLKGIVLKEGIVSFFLGIINNAEIAPNKIK